MGKFLALILVAVSAYFVADAEGKQYMDLTCHPGFTGEARALQLEEDCGQTHGSGTECFKMCVLKGLGFIIDGDRYGNPNTLYLDSQNLQDNVYKLFSPEAQDVAEKLRSPMYNCGETAAYITDDMPCGSSSDSLYNCLEKALSC